MNFRVLVLAAGAILLNFSYRREMVGHGGDRLEFVYPGAMIGCLLALLVGVHCLVRLGRIQRRYGRILISESSLRTAAGQSCWFLPILIFQRETVDAVLGPDGLVRVVSGFGSSFSPAFFALISARRLRCTF